MFQTQTKILKNGQWVFITKLELKKVIAIHTFKIIITHEMKIDLFKGVQALKKTYHMRYNPDMGISGVHFKYKGKAYLLYSNGSLCAYGNYTQLEKEKIFKRFWNKNKAFFLVSNQTAIHI